MPNISFPAPSIVTIKEKKLLGMQYEMTFKENKTAELWRTFMPRNAEIKNRIQADLISMQVYPANFSFEQFNPNIPFTKWAAVEVKTIEHIPQDMHETTIPSGLYAVFHYTGLNTNTAIFEYIYAHWIPNSGYTLDHRPHFEVLGEKYRNGDPNSEEDIYIPIK